MRQSLSETVDARPDARPLLWLGLFLTAALTLWALADPATTGFLARQVEAGYPGYTPDEVGAAVGAYVAILVSIGMLGVAGWGTTLVLVRVGRRRVAAWCGAALCVTGVLIASIGLATPDTSGVTGLAPVFGWAMLIPCALGAAAVVALFRQRSR